MLLLFIFLPLIISQAPPFTPKPIIGILTQPSPFPDFPKENYSQIQIAYVRDMEAAGAKVLAIKYDEGEENLRKIFNGLNGLVLTGGGTNLRQRNATSKKKQLTQYGKTAKFLIKLAREENKGGRYFPVWGTCLGFEILLMSYSTKTNTINRVFGMVNHIDNLNFIQKPENSRLFKDINADLLKILEEEKTLYFNHKNAVLRDVFYRNKKLTKSFNVLALNEDHEGNIFVSAAEHKKFPFYGVQFHPEKNAYDWQEEIIISRSLHAVMIQQYFSNFFVNEARKNSASATTFHEEMVIDLATSKPTFKKQYGMITIFLENVNFTITKAKQLNSKIRIKRRRKLNKTKVLNKKGKIKIQTESNNYINIIFGSMITCLLLLIALILRNKNYNNEAQVNGKEKPERKQKHKLN